MIDANELVSMAESLPIEIKTLLIDKLLNSLNPSKQDVDQLWAQEAEKRVAEIQEGKVATIPGEEVTEQIRKRFSK
ncbi:MAG TPA: addiction module protein [Myxococcota bacterium]|nr:addiction module protein [Myxococcota bacterium]